MKPGIYKLKHAVERLNMPTIPGAPAGQLPYQKVWPAGLVFKVDQHSGDICPYARRVGDAFAWAVALKHGDPFVDCLEAASEPFVPETVAQVAAVNGVSAAAVLAALVATGELTLREVGDACQWANEALFSEEAHLIHEQLVVQPVEE